MQLRFSTRTALGTAALLALGACIVNLSFEMKRSLALQSQSAGAVSQNVLIDLSQYKEITDHKNQIKSLDLDYAEVTISRVNSGSGARISGALKLRKSLTTPPVNDVKVGDLNDMAVAVGTTKRLNGTPQLDAFLLLQLHEQGTFYAVVEGAATDAVDLVLEINLHAAIGYDTGLF
jgi:hypothetical protein